MKQIIQLLGCGLLLAFVLLICTFHFCTKGLQKECENSYQRIIQTKYDYMTSSGSPKLVIVSGSNGTFGIDNDLLEKQTGYNVCNLAIQASLGQKYTFEMALDNLQSGDIVLIMSEYEFLLNYDNFSSINETLLISGIGNKHQLYKYLDANQWISIWGNIEEIYNYKKKYKENNSVYNK